MFKKRSKINRLGALPQRHSADDAHMLNLMILAVNAPAFEGLLHIFRKAGYLGVVEPGGKLAHDLELMIFGPPRPSFIPSFSTGFRRGCRRRTSLH